MKEIAGKPFPFWEGGRKLSANLVVMIRYLELLRYSIFFTFNGVL